MDHTENLGLQVSNNQGNSSMQFQEAEDNGDKIGVELKRYVPYVGMQFNTLNEAKKNYEDYGRQKGFYIRTRTSYKGR